MDIYGDKRTVFGIKRAANELEAQFSSLQNPNIEVSITENSIHETVNHNFLPNYRSSDLYHLTRVTSTDMQDRSQKTSIVFLITHLEKEQSECNPDEAKFALDYERPFTNIQADLQVILDLESLGRYRVNFCPGQVQDPTKFIMPEFYSVEKDKIQRLDPLDVPRQRIYVKVKDSLDAAIQSLKERREDEDYI